MKRMMLTVIVVGTQGVMAKMGPVVKVEPLSYRKKGKATG